ARLVCMERVLMGRLLEWTPDRPAPAPGRTRPGVRRAPAREARVTPGRGRRGPPRASEATRAGRRRVARRARRVRAPSPAPGGRHDEPAHRTRRECTCQARTSQAVQRAVELAQG